MSKSKTADARKSFNDWCAKNYGAICQKLNILAPVDEDALHDALVYLAENFAAIEPRDYEKTLIAQYRKISGQYFSQSIAEFRPDELFFNLLPNEAIEEEEDDEKAENARKALAKSILRFVRHSFSDISVTLLDMRIKGYSYRNLADCLGMTEKQVRENEKLIITRVRAQFAYAI